MGVISGHEAQYPLYAETIVGSSKVTAASTADDVFASGPSSPATSLPGDREVP
jgi:hypothetical protein